MKYTITITVLSLLFVSTVSGCGTMDSISASENNVGISNVAGTVNASSESDSSMYNDSNSTESVDSPYALVTTYDMLDFSDMFTDRDQDSAYDESSSTGIILSDDSIEINGNGANVAGTTVTITEEGTYVISGEIYDGQIIVDADDTEKIQIVLNGCSITNDDSSCILIRSADKVFITLAEETENFLSDTGIEYSQETEDYTVDGVIFSKEDLVLNGNGSLKITAGYDNAIVGKDDLKVTGGNYEIYSSGKGITANDSIRINNGSFIISSDDDALHTSNSTDKGKGYIYISGGQYTISSGDDGIHAETCLVIADGNIDILESYEGFEGSTIDIEGGNININSSDDGMNASLNTSYESDEKNIRNETTDSTIPDRDDTKRDVMEPDMSVISNNSMAAPSDSIENMASYNDTLDNMIPEMNNPRNNMEVNETGGEMMDVQSDAYIRISSGNIFINSDGDSIDSNGYIYIDDGTLTVEGPVSEGNASLDYGIAADINGGTVILTGSTGMAEAFSETSTQYSIMYNFENIISGGTEVTLADENGNIIMQYTPSKNYQSVIFSNPDIENGSYTISAGNFTAQIDVENTITSNGLSHINSGMDPRV